mmetsp:Transcript_19375/g.40606  ORF Transcript_19375/g.40606 Transcript_19375/m.40606 type:complete len:213 (+) Transcript_19375:596-1234(+)
MSCRPLLVWKGTPTTIATTTRRLQQQQQRRTTICTSYSRSRRAILNPRETNSWTRRTAPTLRIRPWWIPARVWPRCTSENSEASQQRRKARMRKEERRRRRRFWSWRWDTLVLPSPCSGWCHPSAKHQQRQQQRQQHQQQRRTNRNPPTRMTAVPKSESSPPSVHQRWEQTSSTSHSTITFYPPTPPSPTTHPEPFEATPVRPRGCWRDVAS